MRGGGDEAADEGAEGGVALVPVEGATLLDVAGVPVQSVAIVVRVAARHVPEHGADVPDEDDGGGLVLLVTGGAGGGGGKADCIMGGCGRGWLGRLPVAGGAWRRKLGVLKRRKEEVCGGTFVWGISCRLLVSLFTSVDISDCVRFGWLSFMGV